MIHWQSALEGLDERERQQVCDHLVLKTVGLRTPIFEANDQASMLYIVKAGRVRLIYRDPEGLEFTTGVWTQGYVIGLISAFLNERRFLAAESLEETELLGLSREKLHDLMHDIPQFAINVARILGQLAHDSILRSGPLVTQPAANRLANTLVRLATPTAPSSPVKGVAPASLRVTKGTTLAQSPKWVVQGLTQEDLARLVGVSRSWINTTLASFEERKLIRRLVRSIEIVDMDELARLVTVDRRCD